MNSYMFICIMLLNMGDRAHCPECQCIRSSISTQGEKIKISSVTCALMNLLLFMSNFVLYINTLGKYGHTSLQVYDSEVLM